MSRISIVLFNLFLMTSLTAQEVVRPYSPLTCKGEVPQDFSTYTLEKYQIFLSQLNAEYEGSKKEIKEDFAGQSSKMINELLLSGKVFYGDTLTSFINQVANRILIRQPELRAQLRFYLLNIPEANALSTDQGIIFITCGLMARVQNEAQLAFILCHEITHYVEKHNFESRLKREELLKSNEYKRQMGNESKLLSYFQYSRENETIADKKGFVLFCQAGYHPDDALRALELIKTFHLPMVNFKFNISQFENKAFVFKQKYYPEESEPISEKKSKNEAYSTHPNIEKRILDIEKEITHTEKVTTDIPQEVSQEFTDIQKIARFEMGYYYLTYGAYQEAYCHALILDHLYPQNEFSAELKCMSLYGLSAAITGGKLKNYIVNSDIKIQDEVWKTYYFFDKLSGDELTVLALMKIAQYRHEFPDNSLLNKLYFASIDLLIKDRGLGIEDFETEVDSTENDGERSINSNDVDIAFAFLETFKIPQFKTDLEQGTNLYRQDLNKRVEIAGMSNSVDLYRSSLVKSIGFDLANEQIENLGYALGMDHIVLFAPEYIINSKSKKNSFSTQDEKRIWLRNKIIEFSNDMNLGITFIEKYDMSLINTELINQYKFITNWRIESILNGHLNMVSYNNVYINSIAEKLNTQYIGFIVIEEKGKYIRGEIQVIDMSNSSLLAKITCMGAKPTKLFLVESSLYYLLHQLHQKPNN